MACQRGGSSLKPSCRDFPSPSPDSARPRANRSPMPLAVAQEAINQNVVAAELPDFLEAAHRFATAQGKQLDVRMPNAFAAMVRAQFSTAQNPEIRAGAANELYQKYVAGFFTSLVKP